MSSSSGILGSQMEYGLSTAEDRRARTPRTDYLDVTRPEIDEETISEVASCLRSGWVTSGPRVRAFEHLLADRLGVPRVLCVSGCTGALLLALRLLGVGRGDEVLVPTLTFAACANVVE